MAAKSISKVNIAEAPRAPLRLDRGTQIRLIGSYSGASNIDMHVNVLNVNSGRGPYHYHEKAENAYLVLEGTVEVIVEGTRHLLTKDDVVFVPPGIRHAAGNGGDTPAVVLEIYSPVGEDFHILQDADDLVIEGE